MKKLIVKWAVRILCKAGVLGDAPTLNAIDKWLEEQ